MYKISEKTLDDKSRISVILVSNVSLINQLFISKPNTLVTLNNLESKQKDKIITSLKNELMEENISLKNIFYLYRNVGIDDYEYSVNSKMIELY